MKRKDKELCCSWGWTYYSCSVLDSRRVLCIQVCSPPGSEDTVAACTVDSLWCSNSSHRAQMNAWQNLLHTQFH